MADARQGQGHSPSAITELATPGPACRMPLPGRRSCVLRLACARSIVPRLNRGTFGRRGSQVSEPVVKPERDRGAHKVHAKSAQQRRGTARALAEARADVRSTATAHGPTVPGSALCVSPRF
jgi:hypothetical protein